MRQAAFSLDFAPFSVIPFEHDKDFGTELEA
jgi:hypothetical protein